MVTLLNNVFSFLLIFEIGMKMISQGLKKYFNNNKNLLEFIVIMVCILQIFLAGTKLSSIENEIKLMRAFKALMFYRVIKYNVFAVRIMNIAQRTVPSYLNLAFLMFFFISIFAIIGMEFFVKRFNEMEKLS